LHRRSGRTIEASGGLVGAAAGTGTLAGDNWLPTAAATWSSGDSGDGLHGVIPIHRVTDQVGVYGASHTPARVLAGPVGPT
jgi:hypothetical protein